MHPTRRTFNNGLSQQVYCGDFFEEPDFITKIRGAFKDADLVIGNPPWVRNAKKGTPAAEWCKKHDKPLPDSQIAIAFVWKAGEHVSSQGRICFVLPHGTLLNHRPTAIKFQKAWVTQHTINRVLNLADLRMFLFNEAKHPAIVVNYQNIKPQALHHRIEYWCPKADWTITQAEVIPVSPTDRAEISLNDLIKDLNGLDGPQAWTQRFWGAPRDLRLIDRLSLYPRLRDRVRKSKEKNSTKPWVVAGGFEERASNNGNPNKEKTITLPSNKFIESTVPIRLTQTPTTSSICSL